MWRLMRRPECIAVVIGVVLAERGARFDRIRRDPIVDEIERGDVVRRGERRARALGLVGLTPQEKEVSGFDKAVQQGRFFERADELSCLLPQRMAA